MGLKSTRKLDGHRREMVITIDADTFEKALQRAYRKRVREMNVPGFRKGKAPRNIIEKFYGEKFFYEDALDDLYPGVLSDALDEGGVRYVRDSIDTELISADRSGVEFKAVVTEEPDEIDVGTYTGLPVERLAVKVDDADVEDFLKRLADRTARTVTVSGRPVQDGDIAVIDFEGFADGVPFDGGKGEDYELTIGSGTFIPGFEAQVTGHNAGDAFDVNVTFPEDYGAADLAGKPAVFKVTLKEIRYRELPEMDDEFAKDVSEFDTLEELRADIRERLTEERRKMSDDDVNTQLEDALAKAVRADIPPAMIRNEQEDALERMADRFRANGLDLNGYLERSGQTKADLMEEFRPNAEKAVRERLALRKIAELERLEPAAEEIDREYADIAKDEETDEQTVRGQISEKAVREVLRNRKALDFVREHAAVTEVEHRSARPEESEKTDEPGQAENADAPAPEPAEPAEPEGTGAGDAERAGA